MAVLSVWIETDYVTSSLTAYDGIGFGSLTKWTIRVISSVYDDSNMANAQNDEINEIITAVLSLIIPGLGHILISGQTKRGAIWLVGAFAIGIAFFLFTIVTLGLGALLAPALFLIPIGSAVDGYLQAQKINNGEIVV